VCRYPEDKGKVKVKGKVPVLFLTEHHAMKAYWGSEGIMMKFSQAISRVKWLSAEKTNVSKTISVLVLRVLV
jgi:hypothetical protein